MGNAIRVDDVMSTSLTRVSVKSNTIASKKTGLTTRALKTTALKTRAPTARSAKKKTRTAAPTTVAPTAAPTAAPTICTSSSTVLDDFESMSLTGWTDGRLDTTSTQYFTSFLGRYGRSMSPEKTYMSISTTASKLTLEFDFYEIDTWDHETFTVVINNFTVPLGTFFVFNNEGTFGGVVGDVHFEILSGEKFPSTGFDDDYPDQIHHVTIDLPIRFVTGFLKVRFESGLDEEVNNESFGIDNIKLTTYECGV